jgi:PrsW family intramembrane metalloprotease
MSGIDTMLLVVYAAGVTVWGGLIFFLNGLRPRLLWLLLISLPLSLVVNLLIKRPVIIGLSSLIGQSVYVSSKSPWWWLFILLLISPVFEEAIKVLPLALPWVRRLVTDAHAAIWVGLALGVSFGMGEAAYLAYSIEMSPQYSGLSAAAFAGFGLERWITCLLHGVMTAVFMLGIQQHGWRILTGYLLAAFIHTFINFPALLVQIGVLPVAWAELALLIDSLLAIGLLFWLWRTTRERLPQINLPTDPQSAA